MNRRRRGKSNRRANRQPHASELFGYPQRTELLIDGYNLLHVTRFQPRGDDPGELRRCREALLQLLAESIPAERFPDVTVVFDAHQAPQRLASELCWHHLTVLFARKQNSADDLIIQRVRKHPYPQSVIVVSSDHRVQVAATRRKALAVDSEVWFDALLAWEPTDGTTTAASQGSASEASEPRTGSPAESPENPFPQEFFDELEKEFPGEV